MPLPNLEKLRESATGAVEMASGKMKEASQRVKLMRTGESEAELVDEEASQTPSQASSRFDEFTDNYCPKLTWQQVSCMALGCLTERFNKCTTKEFSLDSVSSSQSPELQHPG